MLNKVFVYGTLKKGLGNHRIVQKYVRSVQNASMRGWMFNLGFYPAVVMGSGVVQGQLLELEHPEKAFSAMDILEGFQEPEHPRNLYERVITTVEIDNGETEQCFVYIFHDRNKPDLLKSAVFMPSGVWDGNEQKRLYFAYGSCMSEESSQERLIITPGSEEPSWKVIESVSQNIRKNGAEAPPICSPPPMRQWKEFCI